VAVAGRHCDCGVSFLPYWGSIVLGFIVAIATFITGALAAVQVAREIQKNLA
jgi:hypothetical protein